MRGLMNYHVNLVIKILIASDFIIWSSANLVGPVFAIFIADRLPGGSIAAVGMASMIFFITKSIVEIPVGTYIDKSKSERDDLYSALLGTILNAVSFFLYPLIDSVWQLYLIQIVSGAAAAIAYPGWYSIFTRHIDKSKEAFEWSLYDVLLGLGMAVTAGLGALMVDKFGFNVVFNVIGFMMLVGAALLFIIQGKVFQGGTAKK
ncbi:MAG: hypothetical protein UT32_C0042G0010 [Parcubacteria group bacterium GW2011_GWC2_39_14]|nr:MAG: hypothetical protein UT32_C0042G0010 [Parcubacteria group bacterium GW2011_GWC2_39_14]